MTTPRSKVGTFAEEVAGIFSFLFNLFLIVPFLFLIALENVT